MGKYRQVLQKDPRGCGAACLAMISGMSYDEVKSSFVGQDFTEKGLIHYTAWDWLCAHGFWLQPRWTVDHVNHDQRKIWPPLPWADIHLCQVVIANNNHFVVMLRDGTVFDPLTERVARLSDYEKVNHVVGILKETE